MIYLRAAKKIYPKHRQAAGEEEAYNSSVLQQGWTLLIESSNGTHFNKGLEQTTLTARIYAANGVDYTKDLAALTPFWQINDSEWRGSGWTTDLHKSDIPAGQVITTISCTIKLIDVLKIVSSIPLSADQIHLNEDIKGELKIYNPYSVVDLVPLPNDIIRDLNISWRDSQLVIGGVVSPSLKGERGLQGLRGEDGKSVTASEVVATLNTQEFRGTIRDVLKSDIDFKASVKGEKGDKGEDAPVPDVLIGSVWESGYIDENDGTTIGGSGVDVHCPEYYPIYPGADIRLTSDYVEGAIGGWSLLFFYDKSKEFISATRYTKGRNAVELSLKAPGNAYYLRMSKLSSAHVVRLYTLLRGVQISDLTANTEFMQHTAQKVSEVGRFVSETALNSALADKVSSSQLIQELSKKQNAGDYVVSSYFSSELSKKQPIGDYATNTAVGSVATRAIRPITATVIGSSTPNPFASILNDPNGEAQVVSLNIVEGTDLYLPPARLCAVGTKIFLRGSTMSCPVTPYHHSTSIRPIRIYSNERDVYSAGRYYTNNQLLETFTNAEWRVDLECIVAGCGLKGWLWTNSVESKNLLELSSSITTAIQSIAETRQDLNTLKNSTLKKGEGLQLGFYNLVNHNSGTYHVKATDYHIVARRTTNGDNYPCIRVSENLPDGHEFIVDIPFNDCRVRFLLPSGGTTWGNGGTEWQSGYRYHVTKSHTKEWGVVKTAYAQ